MKHYLPILKQVLKINFNDIDILSNEADEIIKTALQMKALKDVILLNQSLQPSHIETLKAVKELYINDLYKQIKQYETLKESFKDDKELKLLYTKLINIKKLEIIEELKAL